MYHDLVISGFSPMVKYWPKHGSEGQFWRKMRIFRHSIRNANFPSLSAFRPSGSPVFDPKMTKSWCIPKIIDLQWVKNHGVEETWVGLKNDPHPYPSPDVTWKNNSSLLGKALYRDLTALKLSTNKFNEDDSASWADMKLKMRVFSQF